MPLLDGLFSGYLRMSKYISKSARKRAPLHRKMGNKNYYKGTGSATTGRVSSTGRFIKIEKKRIELNVPDMTGFKLKPYVSPTTFKYPEMAGIGWPPEALAAKKKGFFGL